MPELIEVEFYRRAAEVLCDSGSPIVEVIAPDPWYLKGGLDAATLRDAVVGLPLVGLRRRGKLLVCELDGGVTLGLRFGMTGRLIVDGEAPIDRLLYTSARDDPAWDRFALRFGDGRVVRMQDPRRLGGVELCPDEKALGPDAATLTAGQLRSALAGSNAALKARLMDQSRVAGLGNLLTDETLWRARLSPWLPASSLSGRRVGGLAATVRATVGLLSERGGSHTGDLQPSRARGGHCPRCGEPLTIDTVGGRTTYWCARCQQGEHGG